MKKKSLLLLLLLNCSQIFTAEPSAPPANLSKEELAFILARREENEQVRLRTQAAWQEASGLPPHRGVSAISGAIPRQVFIPSAPTEQETIQQRPYGHSRQRSLSNPAILTHEDEDVAPGYSLIPTEANTDQLLALANRELEIAIQINNELTTTLKHELSQAAQRHQSITVGALSPNLPKRGWGKKVFDLVTRKSETDRHDDALKQQTRRASKTEQESREAIIPLVARVLTVKERMLALQVKVIETAQASEQQHRKIKDRSQPFHGNNFQNDELRHRTQSMYIPRGRQNSGSTTALATSSPS